MKHLKIVSIILVVWLSAACSSTRQTTRQDSAGADKPSAGQPSADQSSIEQSDSGQSSASNTSDKHDHTSAGHHRNHGQAESAAMHGHCPMEGGQTSVSATNFDNGAAVDFETGGDVAELQNRLQWLVEQHNQTLRLDHPEGPVEYMKADVSDKTKPDSMLETTEATYEASPTGGRIQFAADHLENAPKLQQDVAAYVSEVQHGGCPVRAMTGGEHEPAAAGQKSTPHDDKVTPEHSVGRSAGGPESAGPDEL